MARAEAHEAARQGFAEHLAAQVEVENELRKIVEEMDLCVADYMTSRMLDEIEEMDDLLHEEHDRCGVCDEIDYWG